MLRGGVGGDNVVPLPVCLADGEAVEQRAKGVDFNLVLVGVADLDGLEGDLDGERHGGIIPLENSRQIPSFNDRIGQLNQEKKAIAHKALDFLKPNQVNFFDVSTVVLKLAQQVQQPMTIFSHSLDNAIMLSDQEQVAFHLLGGKFYPRNRFYYALNEAELLRDISFDLAFIGAAGLKNGQISFEDQEDTYLKKLALKQAKTKILLAEQAKVKKESTYILGNISDFDYWITDQKPSPELEALLAGKVTIIY